MSPAAVPAGDRPPAERESPAVRAAARWPAELVRLARSLEGAKGPAGERARGELWVLLLHALQTRIRAEGRRLGPIPPEDLADLAAERALELVARIDQGRWDLSGANPASVAAFVGTVARNAMIDRLRGRARHRSVPLEAQEARPAMKAPSPEAPESAVACREFVEALGRCLGRLRTKHRRIWLWRVVLELPTRVVAAQPEVRLKPGHVDVIQQRTRGRLAECMRASGFHPVEIPVGAVAELWRRFRWIDPEEER